MDPPLPRLSLVVALLLGFARTAQVDYCKGICPEFEVLSSNSTFQEREYNSEALWICSEVKSASSPALMAARKNLLNFIEQQSQIPGKAITDNTWPAVVSVKQTNYGKKYTLCWFLPPNIVPSKSGPVTVENLPQTLFVRVYHDIPSIANGEANAQILRNDLDDAKRTFDPNLYFGVAYESYVSFSHHDEIWIPKL